MRANLEQIEAAQGHLERELLTKKIIGAVRREPSQGRVNAGRYHFLWRALQASADDYLLLELLGADQLDQFQFEVEWEEFVGAHASDPAFLHGVALMHWEWALELDEKDSFDLAVHHYQRAKYYWTHLLGRQGYWESFSDQYYQDEKGERENLSADLFQEVYQKFLEHHYRRCRTCFSNDNLEATIFHLKCLCNWNILEDGTCAEMYPAPLLEQEWDQIALEEIDKEAKQFIGRWISEWLGQLTDVLDDPNVELGRGISKNFKGVLAEARPYLALVPTQPPLFSRLLKFMLTQANTWCYEAAIADDVETALAVIEAAKPTIELFETFLIKLGPNAIATPDHKTLSRSYLLWAQLVDDPTLMTVYAEKGVEWDPADRQAQEVRHQMSRMEVQIRLDQAQEYLGTKAYQKALNVLEEIDLEAHPDAKEPVHSFIAVTHFQWGIQCAEFANQKTEELLREGIIRNIEKTEQMRKAVSQLKAARDHMTLALEYEPDHPVLKENLESLELEAKYRPYSIKMQIGIQRFDSGAYDDALDALEGNFPKSFPGNDTVIQIRAGCFFRRAIQQANNERFDAAVADMRQAQKLVPDNEFVSEQLAVLRHMQTDAPYIDAVNEAQTLMGRKRYEDALRTMQNIPSSYSDYQGVQRLRSICEFNIGVKYADADNLSQAIAHLEKAQEYDPGEPAIRRQLAELRKVQQLGGFKAIERRNSAFKKAEQVVQVLNAAGPNNPLTPEQGYMLLEMLEEAVRDSGSDPQIVALRDQLASALYR